MPDSKDSNGDSVKSRGMLKLAFKDLTGVFIPNTRLTFVCFSVSEDTVEIGDTGFVVTAKMYGSGPEIEYLNRVKASSGSEF